MLINVMLTKYIYV